jgi:hypothetical protein
MQSKPPDVVGDDKLAEWEKAMSEIREHMEAENIGSTSDIRDAEVGYEKEHFLSTSPPTLFILRPYILFRQ